MGVFYGGVITCDDCGEKQHMHHRVNTYSPLMKSAKEAGWKWKITYGQHHWSCPSCLAAEAAEKQAELAAAQGGD